MKADAFERWAAETPAGFAFALKGHRRVTHMQRLADADETLEALRPAVSLLGDKLAAVLWQLPPEPPEGRRAAAGVRALAVAVGRSPPRGEFRHRSWCDEEVWALLADHGLANCISDAPRWPMWSAVTTDLVYVRLHGRERLYASAYGESGLAEWAERTAAWLGEGRTVHIYFDNDAEGAAPYDAMRLIEMVTGRRCGGG